MSHLIEEGKIHLTKDEFEDLLAYNVTLPTGTIIGKRWKRQRWDIDKACRKCPNCKMGILCGKGWINEWDMGEYVEEPDQEKYPNSVAIKWREIVILGAE